MPRVLIADNDVVFRGSLQDFLRNSEPTWEVSVADDETDAIRVARNYPPDLVLTDLDMDQSDGGMILIRDVRLVDPTVMVILYTGGRAEEVDRRKAFKLGAFDIAYRNASFFNIEIADELLIKGRSALLIRDSLRKVSLLRKYCDLAVFSRFSDEKFLRMHERTVTVCFWDIRGFTNLCEILKGAPDALTGFLRDYCDTAADIVFQHAGVLDKYIGDGVMALFGLLDDTTASKGAIDAVRAAIALRNEFEQIISRWKRRFVIDYFIPDTISLGVGCGINTGVAMVGNAGTDRRDQFTALGRTVNLAARLQGKAREQEILIAEPTFGQLPSSSFQLGDKITFNPNELKGFSTEIFVYPVIDH